MTKLLLSSTINNKLDNIENIFKMSLAKYPKKLVVLLLNRHLRLVARTSILT